MKATIPWKVINNWFPVHWLTIPFLNPVVIITSIFVSNWSRSSQRIVTWARVVCKFRGSRDNVVFRVRHLGEHNNASLILLETPTMSSQRVIQDSDDESGDDCSDVATSIDPLQDPSLLYAPTASNDRARPAEHGSELMPASIPESNLPQVDFDRYLRPESSIMAGDYEDERWVSTADAAPTGGKEWDHPSSFNFCQLTLA